MGAQEAVGGGGPHKEMHPSGEQMAPWGIGLRGPKASTPPDIPAVEQHFFS